MSNYFDDPGRIGPPDGLLDWSDELDDDAFWDDDQRGRSAPLTILPARQAALAAAIYGSVQGAWLRQHLAVRAGVGRPRGPGLGGFPGSAREPRRLLRLRGTAQRAAIRRAGTRMTPHTGVHNGRPRDRRPPGHRASRRHRTGLHPPGSPRRLRAGPRSRSTPGPAAWILGSIVASGPGPISGRASYRHRRGRRARLVAATRSRRVRGSGPDGEPAPVCFPTSDRNAVVNSAGGAQP